MHALRRDRAAPAAASCELAGRVSSEVRVEREAIDALGPGGGDSDEGGGNVVISGEWYFRWC